MKRFASTITRVALAGSLIGAAAASQAQSTMYLVPISSLNNGGLGYAPGSKVSFAVVLNLGSGSFGSFSVPTAVAYLSTEFGTARPTSVSGSADAVFDLLSPTAYSTTASTIGGAKIYAIQATPGHSATQSADGNSTLAVPAGVYTLGTFLFPISPANVGSTATVYLPTAFNYSNRANNTDGAFVGTAPTLAIAGKDILGNSITDTLSFPASGKSLTFQLSGGSPSGVLSGTLHFSQIAANAANQNVTFQFRNPSGGAILSTQTASVPPSGVFSLNPVPLQTYLVWIKPDKYLAQTVLVVSNNGFAPISLSFEGGDANNDNSVDTSDFGILVGAYGGVLGVAGSGYDVRADFNGDGYVDPTDFAILVEDYNETGVL